jgi:type IV pilus assembly protein PilF
MKAIILALAVLLAACSSNPKPDDKEEALRAAKTNTALGRQYTELEMYEVALEKLKRAVAYDETYAPAHTMLGVLYETIGETEQAGEEYKLAVRYDPTDGDVNNNYGSYLCSSGKTTEADKYFLIAVKDPFYESPEVAYSNAGICALEGNDLDKAESYLRQSLDYDPKLAAALLPMANVSYQQESYLRARGFLQRYEAVGVEIEESLFLGYLIESKLGDTVSAQRYQQALMEQFPNSEQARQAKGRP